MASVISTPLCLTVILKAHVDPSKKSAWVGVPISTTFLEGNLVIQVKSLRIVYTLTSKSACRNYSRKIIDRFEQVLGF